MASITIDLTQQQVEQLLQGGHIVVSASHVERRQPPPAPPEVRPAEASFFDVFRQQIRKRAVAKCHRSLETYTAVFRKFRSFMGGQDLAASGVTADLMEAFQAYMRAQDLSMNTVSFNFRILRSVYRKAIQMGLTADNQPFRSVYTGQSPTAKRALTLGEVRRIKRLPLADPALSFARDLFLFSFYTRGMAFVDIAYLKPSNVRDGILTYKRRKTGQQLSLKWEPQMAELVARYPSRTGDYMFDIIHTCNGKERNQYRHVQELVNRHLKTVAALAGVDRKLTLYCARHSWATIARQHHVPLNVISRGMGHNNERTTEIYLKTVDSRLIDRANRKILNLL